MTVPEPSVPVRFRSRELCFASGARGRDSTFLPLHRSTTTRRSRAPVAMPDVTIDGKLFLPPGGACAVALPAVILVPGSLGVADSHLRHAETFTERVSRLRARQLRRARRDFDGGEPDAVLVRGVAPATCWRRGRCSPQQPISMRCGSGCKGTAAAAAPCSARSCVASPTRWLGRGEDYVAVLGAYPWCGHQFLDPRVGHEARCVC